METIGGTRVILGSAVGVLGLRRDPCVASKVCYSIGLGPRVSGFCGCCVKLQTQDA